MEAGTWSVEVERRHRIAGVLATDAIELRR
jgi:hypothetical protein